MLRSVYGAKIESNMPSDDADFDFYMAFLP